MKLKNEINDKLRLAMKSKNIELLNVLRSILSKITEGEKLNSNQELTDDEIIKIIIKLAKQREESIALFNQGGREDLVLIEQNQLNVLNEYIPKKYNDAETRKIVEELISNGANNIALLMKELNKYGNLIDKKLASSIAKELI